MAFTTPCLPVVSALVKTDDGRIIMNIDSSPWFAQAEDEDILALAYEGWRHGEASDAIAFFFEESLCADIFTYIGLTQKYHSYREEVGFGVDVDRDMALAWLGVHRPALLEQIKAEVE